MRELVLSSLMLVATAPAMAASLSASDFQAIERRAGIPDRTLYSIAMTESGRKGKPWPWTMNFAGKSFFFHNRETLHKAMVILLSNGERRFDVGPMQVHWRYHSGLFASTWEATDPAVNIAASARILRDRFNESGSWVQAIAAYHSKNEHLGNAYFANFARNYLKAKKDQM